MLIFVVSAKVYAKFQNAIKALLVANWECENEWANKMLMQVWCLQDGHKDFYNAVFCNNTVILMLYTFCKKLYSVSYNKNKVNINSGFYDSVHLFIQV